MTEDIERLKEAEKTTPPEPETADDRHHGHGHTSDSNWFGWVLILVGGIFLFTNVTGFHLDNWWALFILIPAISNFGTAWSKYQRHGRLTGSARGALTGGLILTLVASAFLFNLDWGLIWPIFLIIGGLSALLGGWFN